MTTDIQVNITVDPQEIYDSLSLHQQREFINYNIGDLEDEDLIRELGSRGYNMEDVSK